MKRRAALAALASAMSGAGCLRLQEANGGVSEQEPTAAVEPQSDDGTTTGDTQTTSEVTTGEESSTEDGGVDGPPVTGTSRSIGYDTANTGFYDATGPVESPIEAWTVSFYNPIKTVPALVDGTLYVGADGLTARDARTGEERWSTHIGGNASPVVSNGLVYSSDYGTVAAFDPESGEQQWNEREDAAGLTVVDDLVLAGGKRGLVALDADIGAVTWRALTDVEVDTAPAVAGDVVYVADRPSDRPGRIYALDLATGSERWRYEVGESDGSGSYYYFTGEPVYDDGTIYASCENRVTYAIDAETGTARWKTTLSGGQNPSPAVTADAVYVGHDGGTVTALDRDTGEKLWEARENTGSIVSQVVATTESVFTVGDSGLLVAYDRSNGQVRYRLGLTRARTRAGPLVVDDWIFVGDGDGTLHAFTSAN
ncbi:PQQ-binding-like beta-propeller repeat protein [Haloarchaeobius sp. TZWWS8]|uniref:outer membrane protein assembly factor BamB family protein n=1 Tax=Haloarchaeobius sp. TZWWS8 TaxID=3446121 RepID=UPI003EBFE4AC